MDAATIFGALVILTVGSAWLSGNQVLQKLSLVLLAAWASTNLAVEALGFVRAPLIVPSMDAVFAIIVATIGYMNRSHIALVVFLLYAAVGSVHVGAFILHSQSTYSYYATLNILFLAQLLTVGATGAWVGIRHWTDRSHQRFRSHPSRG